MFYHTRPHPKDHDTWNFTWRYQWSEVQQPQYLSYFCNILYLYLIISTISTCEGVDGTWRASNIECREDDLEPVWCPNTRIQNGNSSRIQTPWILQEFSFWILVMRQLNTPVWLVFSFSQAELTNQLPLPLYPLQSLHCRVPLGLH